MNQSEMMQIILQEFYRIAEIPAPHITRRRSATISCTGPEAMACPLSGDELGDVIIDKPASAGYEKAPKVILQAHMDMVCVAAEGVHFDPLNDPIKIINDGKTLRADGTSLGADDGIGMALCLYILQDTTLRHGPLRVIITVNEEDGMASVDMPAEYLDGDYLINLDWEWLGSLCNSAAGCDFIRFTRKTSREPAPTDYDTLKVTLKGLQGGHSGVGINLGRANALVCLASAFLRLAEADIPVRISAFSGGQAKMRSRPPHRRKSWSQKQRPPKRSISWKHTDRISPSLLEKRSLLISTPWRQPPRYSRLWTAGHLWTS